MRTLNRFTIGIDAVFLAKRCRVLHRLLITRKVRRRRRHNWRRRWWCANGRSRSCRLRGGCRWGWRRWGRVRRLANGSGRRGRLRRKWRRLRLRHLPLRLRILRRGHLLRGDNRHPVPSLLRHGHRRIAKRHVLYRLHLRINRWLLHILRLVLSLHLRHICAHGTHGLWRWGLGSGRRRRCWLGSGRSFHGRWDDCCGGGLGSGLRRRRCRSCWTRPHFLLLLPELLENLLIKVVCKARYD